ncbi:MAG: hypothetical protein VYB41_03065, partial [Bacteroidota bacterium]|nr:hypothetical protein [Bacteroidota bacterium]
KCPLPPLPLCPAQGNPLSQRAPKIKATPSFGVVFIFLFFRVLVEFRRVNVISPHLSPNPSNLYQIYPTTNRKSHYTPISAFSNRESWIFEGNRCPKFQFVDEIWLARYKISKENDIWH